MNVNAKVVTKNARKLSNGSNVPTVEQALETMREYGRQFAKSDTARYDAAIAYSGFVESGLCERKPESAKIYVAAYVEGTGRKMTDGSFKSVASQFYSFASETAIANREKIREMALAHLAKNWTGKDLFAAAYAVNSGINKAANDHAKLVKDGKAKASDAPKVTADFVASRITPKAKAKATVEPPKPVSPADQLKAMKVGLRDTAKALLDSKAKLTTEQRNALALILTIQ